jgi:hypothetical protein
MGVLLRFMTGLIRRGEAAIGAAFSAEALPEDVPLDEGPLDLADFAPLTLAEVSRLEVYCFANCCTSMRYLGHDGKRPIPWIESFGNEFDIVARLGVLAPRPQRWDIEIDGPRYVWRGAWGHLLNECYLEGIDKAQKRGRLRGPRSLDAAPFALINETDFPEAAIPRIYHYINGGSPA